MNVTFYKNDSDPRTIGKTLTRITTKSSVTWKADSSVISPRFVMGYAANLLTCNYIYVTELARYYFIDDISIISAQQIVLQCRCDVLQTYKTAILALSCTIKRQENKYNTYLDDDQFIVKNTRQMQVKKISGSSLDPAGLSGGSACYIASIAGG